ncbi:unnamed protein product, partial [Ixodes pacificus]
MISPGRHFLFGLVSIALLQALAQDVTDSNTPPEGGVTEPVTLPSGGGMNDSSTPPSGSSPPTPPPGGPRPPPPPPPGGPPGGKPPHG